jgi:short-subunit dehydrogenase
VRNLAQEGAPLALWDRDETRLERAAASLKDITGVEAILYEQPDPDLCSTGSKHHACPVRRD